MCPFPFSYFGDPVLPHPTPAASPTVVSTTFPSPVPTVAAPIPPSRKPYSLSNPPGYLQDYVCHSLFLPCSFYSPSRASILSQDPIVSLIVTLKLLSFLNGKMP